VYRTGAIEADGSAGAPEPALAALETPEETTQHRGIQDTAT